jgi:hypothetical protein
MYRRIAMLLAAVTLLSLSGCIILPGHDHCCWRHYEAGPRY